LKPDKDRVLRGRRKGRVTQAEDPVGPDAAESPAGERYLLLADISGYTSFMTGVEVAHGVDFSAGIPAAAATAQGLPAVGIAHHEVYPDSGLINGRVVELSGALPLTTMGPDRDR
jgi:hypothetical protein